VSGAGGGGSGTPPNLSRGFAFGIAVGVVTFVATLASDRVAFLGKGLMAVGAFLVSWAIERALFERRDPEICAVFGVVGAVLMGGSWLHWHLPDAGVVALPPTSPSSSRLDPQPGGASPGAPTRSTTSAPPWSAASVAAQSQPTASGSTVPLDQTGSTTERRSPAIAMTADSQPSPGGPTVAVASEPTHAAPLRVKVLDNYTDAAQPGIPICLGNPSRPESVPGGVVTQTVTVPDGVAAVDSAMVQIDPNSGATATATLSGSGGSVTTSATPSGDTSFAFPRLSVSAGSSLTLTIRFSSQQGKLITVYKTGTVAGSFRVENSCSDGAPSLSPSPYGLRATISGWSA